MATILNGLNAPPGDWVVMDAGIASAATIGWLRSHGYRYLVVSRERTRQFNPELAIDIETATGRHCTGSKSPFRRRAGSQFVQIIRRLLKESGIGPSGTPLAGLWPANGESRPVSGAPTGVNCMSAKPPAPSPGNWLFIAP
ncbi:MAG: hypothetical protein PHD43_05735 [Methylococcales bacterium]|nr:hypothetical protein [Methylococcales bacterium]